MFTNLRPGLLRILGAAGCAAVTALIELVGLPALIKADVHSPALIDLVYAVSLTAASLGWLILRGRSGSRLPIALATLPLGWLLIYLEGKALTSDQVIELLDFHYFYLAIALVTFLAEALAIAGPAWLAAIGGRPGSGPVGRPAFPPPPPAGWAGTPAGPWPTPGAPGTLPVQGSSAGPWPQTGAPTGSWPAPDAPGGAAPGPAGPGQGTALRPPAAPVGPDQGAASWPQAAPVEPWSMPAPASSSELPRRQPPVPPPASVSPWSSPPSGEGAAGGDPAPGRWDQ